MVSAYIWRSTTAVGGLGPRPLADTTIEFTENNVTQGKHIHEETIDLIVGYAENEKPKLKLNEIQDEGLDSVTFTITGTIENPEDNDAKQTVKAWLIEDKTNGVFTKGRHGIELTDFKEYNVVPTATGQTPEQPRGLILVNWKWIKNGEFQGKADFIATVKLNGDIGNTTTTPDYNWTVLHT